MKTELTLPDGTYCYPGQDIPPCRIIMENVSMLGDIRADVARELNATLKGIVESTATDVKPGGQLVNGEDATVDMARYRVLVLSSLDRRFLNLFRKMEPLRRIGQETLGRALAKAGIRVSAEEPARTTATNTKTQSNLLVGVG